MKCISCNEWDFPDNEPLTYMETCPNCDFPIRYTEWIEQMQARIRFLEDENNKLHVAIKSLLDAE